ncbi:MAG: hypothetical protein DI536_11875 [Archangium gephyra]|uniref:Uncharacterized protein n=1 Tax=Archangium gephyra TaxID=48 RepID=A0A2W5UXT6_9BACT|nr:MAG: hypothetical protein DI536_11875 [Archangium gephyra]
MRGGRLFGFAVIVSLAATVRAEIVSLALTPAEPVKGRDTEATLLISLGTDRTAPPVLRANVGALDRVERVGPGKFRARYVLPTNRAPEVAIIVAFAPWPSPQSVEGAFGVLRVPMASSVEVPGRAEPGAEVRIKLGDATFGPVRTQSDGSFRLPVVVPPGYGIAQTTTIDRVGNKRTAKLDLMLPRVDQLACVATPTTLPADGVSRARVLCASSDKFGAATRGAKVQWKGGRGTWSSPRELGDGVQEWTWTAPQALGDGAEKLIATWKQGAVDSTEELTLALSQGAVRTLEAAGDDRIAHQGASWRAQVRARDQLGRPLAGVVVTANGLSSGTTDANGEATLEWRVSPAEPIGARTIEFRAAGPMGREPARLLAWRDARGVRVQVADLAGLPVAGQKLVNGATALTTGDDGSVLVPEGVRELTHAEWPGLRVAVDSATVEARVTQTVSVVVAPPPPVNIRIARSASDFEWWLERSDGTVLAGRAVEIRTAAGSRRVTSGGRSREPYSDLVTIIDVTSRVSAVVEATP